MNSEALVLLREASKGFCSILRKLVSKNIENMATKEVEDVEQPEEEEEEETEEVGEGEEKVRPLKREIFEYSLLIF